MCTTMFWWDSGILIVDLLCALDKYTAFHVVNGMWNKREGFVQRRR